MKTLSCILAVIGLASFCHCAVGASDGPVIPPPGDTVQTGETVNFTFTEHTMRIPVRLPVVGARGVVGPNVLCHGEPQISSRVAVGSVGGYAPIPYAGNLRGALLDMVVGKSANALIGLLKAVQMASSREAKVRDLFGVTSLSGNAGLFTYTVDYAQLQLLQMGQEVRPRLYSQSTAPVNPVTGEHCYTTQQIDQAIAEGVRVVTEIILALNPSALKPALGGLPQLESSPAEGRTK